jgi:hypothetical protein
MDTFTQRLPTLDNYWRAVILFGRNVASYKLALGKSLLELAGQGKDRVDSLPHVERSPVGRSGRIDSSTRRSSSASTTSSRPSTS